MEAVEERGRRFLSESAEAAEASERILICGSFLLRCGRSTVSAMEFGEGRG